MDNVTTAKLLLECLDLTSLHNNDTKEDIYKLCESAYTKYGRVAAVCVFAKFVAVVKEQHKDLKVATVINFPQGRDDLSILDREIPTALSFGADELDVVLPYKTLLEGNERKVCEYLAHARKLCANKVMKIIIESGELGSINMIRKATDLCIEAGADFVKTSTGKTDKSATPEAACAILETIKRSGKNVGFKASGGIKTLIEAKDYLVLASSIMGVDWVKSEHFRIGASSLLNDLVLTIERGY